MFSPVKFSVLAAAIIAAAPAHAVPQPDAPVRAWSAMAGQPVPVLLRQAQDMPTSDMAVGDQPYCAADAEIEQTLDHDFAETLIDAGGHQGMGTELWGSEQMGTWTLVAARDDGVSCIIASGTGYSPQNEAVEYYTVAGLN
ncbi:hypothetical protein MLD63_01925 (plasmid) [Paracoccus sp. TK19116]|uniref:Uncharacterized protein n=1 Tax=Paracoccus albicereus TaxID=2922394 RepID=A0ABT1MLL6_9RHOB|nr:hypothetical protein [Paracoccus albicereus]MCQ0969194.1 hypothetical protein [Paracoccus albicereus]